ncbi:MAG: response regulator [Candidatus Magnetomorum sp.]|nr:response regulator [Candidatus Magnetomorum sp.]
MKTEEMKILVVDDSPMVRKIIRKELESGGYTVDEAEDGFEAIVYSDMISQPDLITLDIEMPGLNGFETCQKLQEKRYTKNISSRPPVIFITGKDTLEDRKKGFTLGAADFISKPFASGDILAAVNTILRPENRLRGMTALVADDNNTARKIVSDVLKREGLAVIEATDGMYAYETMCNHMSDIDLVISDFFMPRLTGEDLCRKIRKELELIDLPIIIITAMSDHAELLRLFKAGATDYLIKPFVKEELIARLSVQLERTHLNRRLRDSINKLKGLNQMKDDLLAVCSHDLRTPLNGIIGFTDLMIEKDYLQSEDKEWLGHIKESGNFLMSLINDILDLSKIQSDKSQLAMEPILSVSLTQACISALKHHAAQKNIDITFEDSSVNGVIYCNKNGLKRVINNLLSNAIKFTPDGGKIVVTVATETSGELSISVQDSGIGIPKDQIPYLFDKFTKTSQSGTKGEKGTGLGMSIVKEMIDRHEGKIEVTSVVNKGTCFKILFPQVEPQLKISPPQTTQTEHCECKSEQNTPNENLFKNDDWKKACKLLMAEDNVVNQQLSKLIFAKHNLHLDLVEDGDGAVEAVQKTRYHAVFMDMQMPRLNGIEATKKIRHDLKIKDLPIIAMTANTNDTDKTKCFDAGMNAFISKPVKIDCVIETLKKQINPEHLIASMNETNDTTNIETQCPDNNTDETKNSSHQNLEKNPSREQQDCDQSQIFDRNAALSCLGGDCDLFSNILNLFIEDTPQLIDTLKKAFQEKEYTRVEMAAHTLKSTASTFFVKKLSNASEKMEHLANEGNWEKAGSYLKDIIAAYDEFLAVLEHEKNKSDSNDYN